MPVYTAPAEDDGTLAKLYTRIGLLRVTKAHCDMVQVW